jgi:hypothetical protein
VIAKVNFAGLMDPVARHLWGAPNTMLSSRGQLRFGTRGSRSVDLARGAWFDHEQNEGGGVLDLIVRETGCGNHRAAMQWLRKRKLVSCITAKYNYVDEHNELLFQVLRYEPKDFRQRRPDGHGGWDWNLQGVRRVLYRLPQLLKAVQAGKRIHIVEGEKDVRRLRRNGLSATTAPGGAGKWRDEYSTFLRDADCVLLPDNDDAGHRHAAMVATSLHGVARSIRIIDLVHHWPDGADAPEHGDVSNWLDDGGTVEKLDEIIVAVPEWQPDEIVEPGNNAEGAETESPKAKKTQKQADQLISVATEAELFHSSDGTAYADLRVNDHRETWPIRSTGFRRWLLRLYYKQTGGAPNPAAVSSALAVIEARAYYDGPAREVFARIARVEDKVYFDLADDEWRIVEIDPQGWRVLAESPVRFCRRRRMLALPTPVAGGSVEALRPYLNVKNYDFTLTVAYLLAALSGRGPYPVIVLLGEAGTAKSTMLEVLKALVDPTTAPLRAPPRENRDLFIAANNSHIIAFDNLSQIPEWLSDALCRLSTGGGFSTRQLYTDEEEQVFDAMRPVALNAIENVVIRGDLADRSIFFTLEAIADDERLTEKEFWAAFEEDRPRIFGALLGAVAHGLRALPDTELDGYPRMADFALWGTACEGALWEPGTFEHAYRLNRAKANADIIEADLIASAIVKFIADQDDEYWQGESAPLLAQLSRCVSEAEREGKYWPKAANALSGRLTRAAPALRKIGIDMVAKRHPKTKRRIWTITRIKGEGKRSLPSLRVSNGMDANGLGGKDDHPRRAGPADRSFAVAEGGEG